jgi:hypothetical protein
MNESAGLSGNRGEIRAVISVTRTSVVPCQLSTSLQTFDNIQWSNSSLQH